MGFCAQGFGKFSDTKAGSCLLPCIVRLSLCASLSQHQRNFLQPMGTNSRMLLKVMLLLRSFSRTIVFGFPLGPWPIQSQVLGYHRNIRYGFHIMEWVLNLMKEWLGEKQTNKPVVGHCQNIVPLLKQHIL